MSLQKIFQKLKSAEVADSWLMHTLVMQHVVKNGLLVFNYLAPKTRLCQRVKADHLEKETLSTLLQSLTTITSLLAIHVLLEKMWLLKKIPLSVIR